MREKRVRNVRKRLKEAEILLDLREHEVMRPLMDGFSSEVGGINARLLSDRTLTERDRLVLMEKRDFVERFVGLFVGAELSATRAREFLKKIGEDV